LSRDPFQPTVPAFDPLLQFSLEPVSEPILQQLLTEDRERSEAKALAADQREPVRRQLAGKLGRPREPDRSCAWRAPVWPDSARHLPDAVPEWSQNREPDRVSQGVKGGAVVGAGDQMAARLEDSSELGEGFVRGVDPGQHAEGNHEPEAVVRVGQRPGFGGPDVDPVRQPFAVRRLPGSVEHAANRIGGLDVEVSSSDLNRQDAGTAADLQDGCPGGHFEGVDPAQGEG